MRERTNPMKGKHHSEETKRKIGLTSKLKAKYFECSIDDCSRKHHAKGLCSYHYDIQEKKKPEVKMRKKRIMKQSRIRRRLTAIEMLGKKCENCGMKFNPDLKKSNLEIHHRYYDREEDKENKSRRAHHEVLKKSKSGINPKRQFALLCKDCHNIETLSHQNPKRAFDMFAWMYGEGLFDEVLRDDKEMKKLTDFMSK